MNKLQQVLFVVLANLLVNTVALALSEYLNVYMVTGWVSYPLCILLVFAIILLAKPAHEAGIKKRALTCFALIVAAGVIYVLVLNRLHQNFYKKNSLSLVNINTFVESKPKLGYTQVKVDSISIINSVRNIFRDVDTKDYKGEFLIPVFSKQFTHTQLWFYLNENFGWKRESDLIRVMKEDASKISNGKIYFELSNTDFKRVNENDVTELAASFGYKDVLLVENIDPVLDMGNYLFYKNCAVISFNALSLFLLLLLIYHLIKTKTVS